MAALRSRAPAPRLHRSPPTWPACWRPYHARPTRVDHEPTTMYRIALVLGSQAAGLPTTLFGIPVIASVNSPVQITLLDPSAILYADSGQFDVDVSDQASVQLDDTPTNPTTAATVLE